VGFLCCVNEKLLQDVTTTNRNMPAAMMYEILKNLIFTSFLPQNNLSRKVATNENDLITSLKV